MACPEGDGGSRRNRSGFSVPRTKDQAEPSARDLAKVHKPSQVLVYSKGGTVQTERTNG
jgi:hypothetical protein